MAKQKYKQTFQTMATNLKSFSDQVKQTEAEHVVASDNIYNATTYWEDICKISQKLGFEANKITIMWTNKPVPSPDDMVAVCSALELACVSLLNVFYSFPVSEGQTVLRILKSTVTDILESCVSFSTVLQSSVGVTYSEQQRHPLVVECGMLLRKCDSMNEMPRNNRLAAVQAIHEEAKTIKDALRELDEARTNEGFLDEFEEDQTWTEADKLIMNPLLGMIKTAGALTKKTMDSIKKDSTCVQDSSVYDTIVQQFSRVSPQVDDLALSLYPPLHWEEAKEQAWQLKNILEEILTQLEEVLTAEENHQWIDFINKAVAHNAAEIQRIFIQHGLAQLSLS